MSGTTITWEDEKAMMREFRHMQARACAIVAVVLVATLSLVFLIRGEASAAVIAVDCGADPGAFDLALASANEGDTLSITGTCIGSWLIDKA